MKAIKEHILSARLHPNEGLASLCQDRFGCEGYDDVWKGVCLKVLDKMSNIRISMMGDIWDLLDAERW